MTTTTITTTPPAKHPRTRALLSLGVVLALAVGGGAATMGATSSAAATGRPTKEARAAAAPVDVPELWSELSVLPVTDRDNITAALMPSVRERLAAIAEGIAVAAEHH
jgi:hypothetical protein